MIKAEIKTPGLLRFKTMHINCPATVYIEDNEVELLKNTCKVLGHNVEFEKAEVEKKTEIESKPEQEEVKVGEKLQKEIKEAEVEKKTEIESKPKTRKGRRGRKKS